MTTEQIINDICEQYNIEQTPQLSKILFEVFRAGWLSGERYAKEIAAIALKEQEQRLKEFYGDDDDTNI